MGTPPSAAAASRIGPTSMPLKPSRVLVPTMPGPITMTAASASRDVTRDRERGEHRHRLVVAAERVAAGDGGVDQIPWRGRRRRDRTSRAGGRRRRSSRRRAGRPGRTSLNATATAGSWLCSAADDHGHAVDRVDLGQRLEVLLGAADVGLEARVPTLDDVAGSGFAPRRRARGSSAPRASRRSRARARPRWCSPRRGHRARPDR